MSEIVKDFIKAVKEEKQGTSPYDTPATVTRIDGDTAWVHIPGGVDETPVKLTVNAKAGDSVQLRVGGGRAWITGNASSPPTDDTRANVAHGVALKAEDTASAAQIEAVRAKAAADEAEAMAEAVHDIAEQAQQDADTASANAQTAITQAQTATAAAQQAQNSLKSVVQGASTVEKAVSVMQTALEAVVDYDPTTDTVQEYFWHDANGAHVLGDTSGYRNDITSTGMKIVDVSDEKVVTEFSADGATIGKSDGSQSYLYEDYHSLRMVDPNGNPYLYVSDLRDTNGEYNATDTFTGSGTTSRFNLSMSYTSVISVTIDGVEQTENVDYTRSGAYSFIFTTAPEKNAKISISYVTKSTLAKAYTFGIRYPGSRVAPMSFAEGYNTTASDNEAHAEGYSSRAIGQFTHAENWLTLASGQASHAEGYNTTASGDASHAEGFNTTASGGASHAENWLTFAKGRASHAEGYNTTASGSNSHAQNLETIAQRKSQTALGEYNIADTRGTDGTTRGDYAVIIGNGTSDTARSNALTVDWNGNVVASGDITDGSGNLLANMPYVDTKANMTFAKVTQALADGKSVFMFDGEYMYVYSSHDTTNDYYWFSRVCAHSGFQRWRLDSSDVWTDEGVTNFADYVIAQGTSGIWRYRKWNSGVYECFGTQTASIAVTTASAGYGGYRSGKLSIPAFPITFAATPTVTATVGSGSQGAWVSNVQPTTTGGGYYLSSGASLSAANRSIQFQVMGRWK